MNRMISIAPILLTATLIASGCSLSEAPVAATSPKGSVSDRESTTALAPSTTESTTTTKPSTTAPTTTERVCPGGETGIRTLTIDSGGIEYDVLVFVPSSAVDGGELPLVLDFHGRGSNGLQQTLLSSYESLAETEGFIVVHPTGLPGPGSSQNVWELIQFDLPERDDIGFANDLIDAMIEDFCVDPGRVYATGMSNGGLFTSRLVCELSDRIAAASSVAGVTHPDECQPSRAVPFIAFHGTDDEVVPYDGGETGSSLEGDIDRSGKFFEQVMLDEFAEFAADMGCSLVPVVSQLSDEVRTHDYEGCDEGVPMTFYEIEGGGHTWPGSPVGIFLEDALGHTTFDVDATALSWELFRQFSLDG